MQWNLDWSLATAEKSNANSSEAAKFQNSIFLPLQMLPLYSSARGGCPMPMPPSTLPSRRHWIYPDEQRSVLLGDIPKWLHISVSVLDSAPKILYRTLLNAKSNECLTEEFEGYASIP